MGIQCIFILSFLLLGPGVGHVAGWSFSCHEMGAIAQDGRAVYMADRWFESITPANSEFRCKESRNQGL